MEVILLDVRELDPPEPLTRTLEALSVLGVGQRLRVLLRREPYPLYGILQRENYQYESEFSAEEGCSVLIWRD
jgi:uncharacterized protein (DUF2249 family)